MRNLSRIVLPACVGLLAAVSALAQTVTVNVDTSAGRRAINPEIYGVAHADAASLTDLTVPLNRYGGNNTSRHNWLQNADNRGFDWYFESVPLGPGTPGEEADTFIATSRQGGAEPMMTIPMVGWVGKLGANRSKLASFSRIKYGDQADCDWAWYPDACNGLRPDWTTPVTGNDPSDANVPADVVFQRGFVEHLVSQWGGAGNGGLRYYVLDNEHSIWHSTHRDVHPVGAYMEEVRNKTWDYAAMIKSQDPQAQVVGPEEWGWSGYFWSGYDQQYGAQHGWGYLPDRAAHGNWDYLPWLLDQVRQRSETLGVRLLDVFTVHYYPQGGEFGNDTSTAMQLRRNRSTRSLWDPNYTDETWIDDQVQLIPRLKAWVSAHYPGTRIGVTEYNWGAEGHINGATAQADVLGIFGREGLDQAARWTTPSSSTPTYKAIKMFRNYDGSRRTFGDTSVRATVPNPDNLSAFAALRGTDGALTVMVVNKVLASGSTPLVVNLGGYFASGPAQVWRLTSANAISRLTDVPVSGGSLSTSVPQQSITLYVIPGQADLIFKDAF
ncbi:MAG TPA: glycoside hydrolase family 44 protein [Vicinamibacteria bacterium]|nr:glycoside hydrolase family 44 protein [Vicinamibacteria bacterium]